MKANDFDPIVQSEAATMAVAINGGLWSKDYTEAQKIGWCQKVEWAMQRYCGYQTHDVVVVYGEANHLEPSDRPSGLMPMVET